MSQSEDLDRIERLLSQFATEIVLTEPGSSVGQLPLRDILFTLQGATIDIADLSDIYQAATEALNRIDGLLDKLGDFSEEDICFLNSTHGQLKRSIRVKKGLEPEEPSLSADPAPTPVVPAPPEIEPTPNTETPQAPETSASPAAENQSTTANEEDLGEEPVLEFDPDEDQELVVEFINEANEHLQNIELGVLELENNPKNQETLASIFRAFHTFKGTAGFLNLVPIKNLAHELESLLDLARQDKLDITQREIDVILKGGDTLREFVTEIQEQINGNKPQEAFTIPTLGLIQQVKAILNGEPPPTQSSSTSQPETTVEVTAVESEPEPELKTTSTAPEETKMEQAEPVVESETPLPAEAAKPAPEVETPPKAAPPTPPKTNQAPAAASNASRQNLNNTVIKVDTLKLDSLFDLVGELVIAQSLVVQDPSIKNINNQRISRNLNQLGRIVNDLQKTAMSIRMVPIRSTFQKMTRVVRDLAVKQGKKVKLSMSGEETELDRTIVEELADPLLHMVRNSIDHGIEASEDRLKNNKDEEGTIQLNAYHQGGNIVIEIKDDGKGLDRDKILQKAIERGLARPDEELSDDEVFKFIFNPGFSTAEQITDISGRGVGMDVVLRNIEKLRGKIEIESTLGEGTTFSIFLPLTLAIIEGLIVKVASHKYIIPTLSVRESFRPENKYISTVHERGEMVNVRGRLLPLIRLYDFFGIQHETSDPAQSIVIVVESGHQQKCVLVDELVGKQEVVIKSLGEHFSSARALSGAAILGDGQVGLILDASALEHGRN